MLNHKSQRLQCQKSKSYFFSFFDLQFCMTMYGHKTSRTLWESMKVCALNRCQNFGNILSRLLSDLWKLVFIASSGEYYTLQRTTHIYYFCVYIKSFPFYLYNKKSDYALSSIYAFFQLVHWIEMSVCTSLGLVGLTILGRPGEIFLKFFSLVRKIVWILKSENITCLKYNFSWMARLISNVPYGPGW